jgi:hypothetical protein
VHGVAEQPHDLQRVAGLEGADSQAWWRHLIEPYERNRISTSVSRM